MKTDPVQCMRCMVPIEDNYPRFEHDNTNVRICCDCGFHGPWRATNEQAAVAWNAENQNELDNEVKAESEIETKNLQTKVKTLEAEVARLKMRDGILSRLTDCISSNFGDGGLAALQDGVRALRARISGLEASAILQATAPRTRELMANVLQDALQADGHIAPLDCLKRALVAMERNAEAYVNGSVRKTTSLEKSDTANSRFYFWNMPERVVGCVASSVEEAQRSIVNIEDLPGADDLPIEKCYVIQAGNIVDIHRRTLDIFRPQGVIHG